MFSTRAHLAVIVVVSLLPACGGSSGGGSSQPPPPPSPAAPAPPSDVGTNAFDGQINVVWTAAADANSYDLYWSTQPGQALADATRIADVASPFNHAGLSNGTAYYYRIVAVNAGGESDASLEVVAIPASDLSISIQQPHAHSLVSGDYELAVQVTATFEVTGVTADLANRHADLVFEPSGCEADTYCGPLSLPGAPFGEATLVVTASDVGGNVMAESRSVIHDEPPVVSFMEPAPHALARPSIHVIASCVDDDPAGCASLRIHVGDATLADVQGGSFDDDVSITDFDGQNVKLRLSATDTAEQEASAEVKVLVESSSALAEVDQVEPGSAIYDANADHVLFVDDAAGDVSMKIRDRASGTDTAIFDGDDMSVVSAFLSPVGALFLVDPPGTSADSVFEVKNGSVTLLDDSASMLAVAGDYAIYGDPAILRELSTGTNLTLADNADSGHVTPSGDAIYLEPEPDGDPMVMLWRVVLYADGVSTPLTGYDRYGSHDPATDGTTSLYFLHKCLSGNDYCLLLHDTTGESMLTPGPGQRDDVTYSINEDWIAYTGESPNGRLQTWARAPDGTLTQVSEFNDDSAVEALGSNGEIAFTSGGRRYVSVPPYDLVAEVSSDLRGSGPVYWEDGTLFVTLGGTLLQSVP